MPKYSALHFQTCISQLNHDVYRQLQAKKLTNMFTCTSFVQSLEKHLKASISSYNTAHKPGLISSLDKLAVHCYASQTQQCMKMGANIHLLQDMCLILKTDVKGGGYIIRNINYHSYYVQAQTLFPPH